MGDPVNAVFLHLAGGNVVWFECDDTTWLGIAEQFRSADDVIRARKVDGTEVAVPVRQVAYVERKPRGPR